MSYDIIGDIHGNMDGLVALLTKLGYRNTLGAWRHPGRQAVYVGDFIDRGPRQVAVCDLVRSMVDAGSARAVMGNHEFNAIAWFKPDPATPGEYLRRHSLRHRAQHGDFLSEVEHTPRHAELVDWFLTLPLWLDLGAIRVVHAHWHAPSLTELTPRLGTGQTLTSDLLVEGSRKGSPAFRTIEALIKGLEVPRMNGAILDKHGVLRDSVRVRWWEDPEHTAGGDLQPGPPTTRSTSLSVDESPVFFGHYSLVGPPKVPSPKFACVDYSASNDHSLVAYRWDGEKSLDDSRFVSV